MNKSEIRPSRNFRLKKKKSKRVCKISLLKMIKEMYGRHENKKR